MPTKELFDEKYFKSINYTDYLFREDRYLKMASEVTEILEKLSLIRKEDYILDYGCAMGFLMKGFEKEGYKNIYGYDISSWAISQASKKGLKILKEKEKIHFRLIICLDVLEHMTDEEIYNTFSYFSSDMLMARIPCSTNKGKSFHLDVSNKDKTHVNCKDRNSWKQVIRKLGYSIFIDLNLLTIYDSVGVISNLCIKI